MYRAGEDRLVVVASDRISAFDVVLDPGIPGKGIVLTQLSNFWFSTLAEVAPHHVLATDLSEFPEPFASAPAARPPRVPRPRAVRIVPVECVVQGLHRRLRVEGVPGQGQRVGRAFAQRPAAGRAPARARSSPRPRRPRSVTTRTSPSTRWCARSGARWPRGCATSRSSSTGAAAALAEARGIIIADTKFEFGLDEQGRLVWADEALTPDSSRFWPADQYRIGSNPPSFDKQFVRDWLEGSGWNKQPPAPTLPAEVVAGTQALYLEAYRRLTGRELTLE